MRHIISCGGMIQERQRSGPLRKNNDVTITNIFLSNITCIRLFYLLPDHRSTLFFIRNTKQMHCILILEECFTNMLFTQIGIIPLSWVYWLKVDGRSDAYFNRIVWEMLEQRSFVERNWIFKSFFAYYLTTFIVLSIHLSFSHKSERSRHSPCLIE